MSNSSSSNCARLTDRTVLITGGASGIGKAAAMRAADEGARVVITDIQNDMGRGVVAEIESTGGRARYLEQDVTSEERWIEIIADIKDNEGSLWGLVNNAGIGAGGPFHECTLEDWRHMFAINVEGVFLGCKHAAPLMTEGGGGSIVNISSLAGLRGAVGLACYCGTKGAVRLFTKAAALELAHGDTHIRCNSVHPGIIDTPIWKPELMGAEILNPGLLEEMGVTAEELQGSNVNLADMFAQGVPGKKTGQAGDIAAGIAYLLSDDAHYVTGSELVIDHGLSAR
ncbi:MAG: SDR family oxidoreductase [Gammaproteobacteria bacterium AqS3]|nr:SDR family oxidoreductase [Gammaproteobacteria bacterium AqS3]